MRVRDIMTAHPLTLSPEMSLEDASWTLDRHRIGGAPVVHNGKVVGVLSKTDLIGRIPGGTEACRVERAMTPLVISVRPDDPIGTAVTTMLREGVHRVLVLGDDDHLSGIVTSTDVLRAIERGRGDLTPFTEEHHAEAAVAVIESDP